jgi:hypothetical protein
MNRGHARSPIAVVMGDITDVGQHHIRLVWRI